MMKTIFAVIAAGLSPGDVSLGEFPWRDSSSRVVFVWYETIKNDENDYCGYCRGTFPWGLFPGGSSLGDFSPTRLLPQGSFLLV